MAVVLPPPVGLGRDTPRRRAARQVLVDTLFSRRLSRGQPRRRLPSHAELRAALARQDRRDVFWVCEMSSHGPLYVLPSREWVRALSRLISGLGVRRLLEVGAGDGFLSEQLRRQRPRLRVVATDSGAWEQPTSRMGPADRRAYRDVAVGGLRLGANVRRQEALAAVAAHRPDLILVAWAPPGRLVERLVRSACRYVLEIGTADDSCGDPSLPHRYVHEAVVGPAAELALCRLDGGRDTTPRSRLSLYYGALHPQHGRW